jgi:hypothetical protein
MTSGCLVECLKNMNLKLKEYINEIFNVYWQAVHNMTVNAPSRSRREYGINILCL